MSQQPTSQPPRKGRLHRRRGEDSERARLRRGGRGRPRSARGRRAGLGARARAARRGERAARDAVGARAERRAVRPQAVSIRSGAGGAAGLLLPHTRATVGVSPAQPGSTLPAPKRSSRYGVLGAGATTTRRAHVPALKPPCLSSVSRGRAAEEAQARRRGRRAGRGGVQLALNRIASPPPREDGGALRARRSTGEGGAARVGGAGGGRLPGTPGSFKHRASRTCGHAG